MKSKAFFVALFVIAGTAVPASAAGLLSFLIPSHNVEVITNSDVYVKDFPAASPQNPIPYLAVATGFRDFGGIVAGIKEPPQKEVLNTVTKTLALRGYQLATNKTPPKVIIVYGWGTLNANVFRPNPDFPDQQLNRYQILRFLGGQKMGIPMDPLSASGDLGQGLQTGLSLQNPAAADFFEMGSDDYYVLVLTAYDINEAKNKKAKALWSTKISCRSMGHSMAEVLPTMLSIAAPHIGKDLAKPLIIDADDHYKPNIEIGPAEMIENDVKVMKR